MKSISLDTLAEALHATIHAEAETSLCTGVSTDTRTLQPGDAYVALRGEHFDGHNFAQAAHARGAVCGIVDHPIPNAGPLLVVDDTLTALGHWAQWSRWQASYRLVAITGSVGKTTTRQMIHHALQQNYRCWQSPKNFNNLIGLPLTLLTAPEETEIVIAELGTNQPGEIGRLSDIAQPDLALVTYTAPAHLAGLGSLEAVVAEKLSIRCGLRPGGALIVNADCEPLIQACRRHALPVKTYGYTETATLRARDATYTPQGSTFVIGNRQVTLNLLGPGNVSNALACWAVGREFGLKEETLTEALASLPPINMRSECLSIGTLTVMNDCYNANPASMANALRILEQLDPESQRRRVFICGTMAELGSAGEDLHRKLGSDIAEARVDLLLTVGPLTEHAAFAAQRLRPQTQICRYNDVDAVCTSLADTIKEQDVILVKGSRSAQLEKTIPVLKERFSPKLATNH